MTKDSTTNEQWVLASYPDGAPQASNFKKQAVPVPTPQAGQVLVKTLCLSVDPYLRIKLYAPPPGSKELTPEEEGGEFAPFKLNEPLSSMFVGEVVEVGKGVDTLTVGDRVSGVGPWASFACLDAKGLQTVPKDLPPTAYLNVLGLIGLSTYFPLVEIGQPKAGETVFVSGGAGAVGSLVGQLCKAFGCKVIASTGSDNKVEALKGLGFDHVFNYKTTTTEEALAKFAPQGVDVYWDNVGGPILDAVLGKMARNGRIVACGSISQYHVLGSDKAYGLRNYFNIVTQTLKWQGFLAFDYVARSAELFGKLGALLKSGKVKALDTVLEGIDKVPEAFMGLFSGENLGKMLIKVAEPSSSSSSATGGEEANTSATTTTTGAEVVTPSSSALDPRKEALRKEIGETREMLALGKGSKVKSTLQSLLTRLEGELRALDNPQATTTTGTSTSSSSSSTTISSSSARLLEGLTPAFTSIDSFGWDQGEMHSPTVSVYVSLDGVGAVKDNVTCTYTPTSFDLKIKDLKGKSYRLFKENLTHEIVPGESKFRVKENRVVVLLRKKKGDYGYEHWEDLTAKKGAGGEAGGAGMGGGGGGGGGGGMGGKGDDAMGGLMDMMKKMYEDGDDTIKKTIAESMMKARGGGGMGGMGGMGGGGFGGM